MATIDTSKIKAGDRVHLSGTVSAVDRVRINGLPFTVTLDGGGVVLAAEESVVYHERTRPTTPEEFRALSQAQQDKMLERWMKKD